MRVDEVLHSTWIVRALATLVLCVFLANGVRVNADDSQINPAAIPVSGGAKGEDRAAEVNTWIFGANGELHVSGGEAGDGTVGKYEQDGGRVILSVADDRFIASYDGESLTFGEGASSNPKGNTDIPSLAGKTLIK